MIFDKGRQYTLLIPWGSKILSKSALSRTISEINAILHFMQKFEMDAKNLLEIALSRTVFEIFTLFHFPLKSKMAAKSGEN